LRAVLDVFAPYGRQGASSRVRVHQWLERIPVQHALHDYAGTASAGARALLTHPFATGAGELRARRARPAGTVLVHRVATPFSRGEVEASLLQHASLGVYDFDDALQWEPSLGRVGQRIFPNQPRVIAAVRAADRVIVGNATLADWAATAAHDVRVIPSCVEPALYRRKHNYVVGDPPRIGWIGSVSTEPNLDAIAPALLAVHAHTGAELVIVGAPRERDGPLAAMSRRVRWTEAVAHNLPADWDVGIMPLHDRLYNRGKCGYKLLEYGAAALPVVGSPVGANASILARMGAPAPTTNDEWADALAATLGAHAEARAACGAQAREVVEQDFSYRAWERRWADALALADDDEASQS
jgi:glycosyltransferase involved in cell wall biosynthesis